MVFTQRPSAHLPCLATRAGLGRISRISDIARFVQGGVVKTFRCRSQMSSLLDRLIASGNVSDVESMLDTGTDVNAENPHGWTPLLSACEHEQPDIIRLLIARGADINYADSNGWTPLHNAIDVAIDGTIQTRAPEIDWQCVGLLLELGADPTLKCKRGKTPFNIIDDYGVNARSSFDEFTRKRSGK